jgi:hypothetical protein
MGKGSGDKCSKQINKPQRNGSRGGRIKRLTEERRKELRYQIESSELDSTKDIFRKKLIALENGSLSFNELKVPFANIPDSRPTPTDEQLIETLNEMESKADLDGKPQIIRVTEGVSIINDEEGSYTVTPSSETTPMFEVTDYENPLPQDRDSVVAFTADDALWRAKKLQDRLDKEAQTGYQGPDNLTELEEMETRESAKISMKKEPAGYQGPDNLTEIEEMETRDSAKISMKKEPAGYQGPDNLTEIEEMEMREHSKLKMDKEPSGYQGPDNLTEIEEMEMREHSKISMKKEPAGYQGPDNLTEIEEMEMRDSAKRSMDSF